MNNNDRRDFLRKIGILALGTAIMPRTLIAGNGPMTPAGNIGDAMNFKLHPLDESMRVIDLHSHPSLKIYLLDKKFWEKHYPSRGDNMFQVEVDTRGMDSNCVKGLITTHYLIEKDVVKDSDRLKIVYKLLRKSELAAKMEHEDLTNFSQVCQMMDDLESQIKISNETYYFAEKIVIARNIEEFKIAIDRGQIPFAHAIEGAHAVGRLEPNSPAKRVAYNLREDMYKNTGKRNVEEYTTQEVGDIEDKYKNALSAPEYNIITKPGEAKETFKGLYHHLKDEAAAIVMKNLETLKMRGVCLITLSHFFKNDLIIHPAEGLAKNEEDLMKMDPQYSSAAEKKSLEDEKPGKPSPYRLTSFGHDVVTKMLDLGIIVDLTHTNPLARRDVLELVAAYNLDPKNKIKRPVVFSHSGVKHVYDELGGLYPDSGYYSPMDASNTLYPGDDEIEAIKNCNGVIGVIPEVFWLKGSDTILEKGKRKKDFLYGIDYMIETINYINDKSGGKYDHVAIGTDFDGLADEPEDLYIYNHLSRLTDEMSKKGIKDEYIKKIMNGNALRILQNGWCDQIKDAK